MIDWNTTRITPPPGWLLTYRKGESRASMACHLGDGEWSDAEGRTTVTHSTFLPPTHWAYLPEPPDEAMILPGDVLREPGPEPEVARLRAQLAAAEQRAERLAVAVQPYHELTAAAIEAAWQGGRRNRPRPPVNHWLEKWWLRGQDFAAMVMRSSDGGDE